MPHVTLDRTGFCGVQIRCRRGARFIGMSKEKTSPGPEADRLVLDGDWQDAVKRAVGVKRPVDGWPKPEKNRAAKPAKRTGRKARKP